MPLYMCSACGCIENTATGGYWAQQMNNWEKNGQDAPFAPLCSEHNPEIGKWHGEWPKKSASGYVRSIEGYIYSAEEAAGRFKHLGPFAPVELPIATAAV